MRRGFVLALMIAAAAAVGADTTAMVQMGYGGDTRIQEDYDDTTDSFDISSEGFSNFGLNLSWFVGQRFGLFVAGSLSAPLETWKSTNGASVSASLEQYDATIGIDGIVGPGYRLRRNRTDLVFGAGLHLGGLAFSTFGSAADSIVTVTLGAGGSFGVAALVDDTTGLSLSLFGGYDFLEVFHHPALPPESRYLGGVFLGIGIGMGYRS